MSTPETPYDNSQPDTPDVAAGVEVEGAGREDEDAHGGSLAGRDEGTTTGTR